MNVKIIAGSKAVISETVQEIIEMLAFKCLSIEEANSVVSEVKKQIESIPVMNAYESLYRDNLPR